MMAAKKDIAYKVDTKQVTKEQSKCLVSTLKWELDNFGNFHDGVYLTDKIDILYTNFFW